MSSSYLMVGLCVIMALKMSQRSGDYEIMEEVMIGGVFKQR